MRESDIRPSDLLDEYLRLSAKDAKTLFPGRECLIDRLCPACGGAGVIDKFEKNGFPIARCDTCRTLYVTAAPSDEALGEYYRSSPSQDFWANVFTPAVADARRDKIVRPRIRRIKEILAHIGASPEDVTDVGAGAGIFLDECRRAGLGSRHRAVEPAKILADACREKGLDVFEGFAGDAAQDQAYGAWADLVTAFEVIEHVLHPASFIREMARLARPGGHILMTGLCGTGFDILVLGKHSRAIAPPHHLTFLSHDGVSRLLADAGLDEVRFLTPGELDVDIVANALKENPAAVDDEFIRHLALQASDEQRDAFQNFLSQNGLSSHMWIVARRPA